VPHLLCRGRIQRLVLQPLQLEGAPPTSGSKVLYSADDVAGEEGRKRKRVRRRRRRKRRR
jgi:hypothetical protein